MYCENCGQNYANVKYTQVINGNRKDMFLCEACSKTLGINKLSLPMDFSTFLSDFFTNFEEDIPLQRMASSFGYLFCLWLNCLVLLA